MKILFAILALVAYTGCKQPQEAGAVPTRADPAPSDAVYLAQDGRSGNIANDPTVTFAAPLRPVTAEMVARELTRAMRDRLDELGVDYSCSAVANERGAEFGPNKIKLDKAILQLSCVEQSGDVTVNKPSAEPVKKEAKAAEAPTTP